MENMENKDRPESIRFMAEDTFSPLLWDEEDAGIGDYKSFFIGDEEYSLSSFEGLEEWYLQADKYDPYTDVDKFTIEGMEAWINKGYEYVKQLRKMLPNDIDLYYGFWHKFIDNHWRFCKAYIAKEYVG